MVFISTIAFNFLLQVSANILMLIATNSMKKLGEKHGFDAEGFKSIKKNYVASIFLLSGYIAQTAGQLFYFLVSQETRDNYSEMELFALMVYDISIIVRETLFFLALLIFLRVFYDFGTKLNSKINGRDKKKSGKKDSQ